MVYVTHDFYFFFGVRHCAEGEELFLRSHVDDIEVDAWTRRFPGGPVILAVEGTKESYCFYAMDGCGKHIGSYRTSARFLCGPVVGRCFTGAMIGLYASTEVETDDFAIFRRFRVEGL